MGCEQEAVKLSGRRAPTGWVAASVKGRLPMVLGGAVHAAHHRSWRISVLNKRWATMMDVGGGNQGKVALWRRAAAHISHGPALSAVAGGAARCCSAMPGAAI